MNKQMYKVVRNINGKLYSCTDGQNEYGRVLEYRVNTPTKPKIEGSYLYVFDCIYAAKDFAYSGYNNEREVWECSAKNTLQHPPLIYYINDCSELWELKNEGKYYLHLLRYNPHNIYMNNTYGCTELTLIQKIT